MKNLDTLHKEIDLIQNIINRLANNSFLLKGWLVSLLVVVFALTKESVLGMQGFYYGTIFLLPIIVFWYLDAFFLHKEKCYRKLYEWVIINRNITTEYSYDLNYERFEKGVKSISHTMFSKTLLLFYGGIIVIALIIIILL